MKVKIKKMEKPEYVQCLGCFVSQAVAFQLFHLHLLVLHLSHCYNQDNDSCEMWFDSYIQLKN